MAGMSLRPTTRKEVSAHLVGFGLIGDIADSKIRRLSGGQRSRLVLAAAMVRFPAYSLACACGWQRIADARCVCFCKIYIC